MPMGTCRFCGCTDARACPGGCAWVEPDLCTACVQDALLLLVRSSLDLPEFMAALRKEVESGPRFQRRLAGDRRPRPRPATSKQVRDAMKKRGAKQSLE